MQGHAQPPPPPARVEVAHPARNPATLFFELTGNTAAVKSVDLVARVQGFLTSINYVDGAGVKQGAQLFTIEKDTYQAQLDQARANLEPAKAGEANSKASYQRRGDIRAIGRLHARLAGERRTRRRGRTSNIRSTSTAGSKRRPITKTSSSRSTSRAAAEKAMEELFDPVIGIILVPMAVFAPAAFLSGLTGQLYRQFALFPSHEAP